jgi:Spy/CpxP family protein refolding chaperone
MKRYKVFSILSATVLITTTAYAQVSTAGAQQQVTTAQGQRQGAPPLALLGVLQGFQGGQVGQPVQRGQRSGGLGPRGAGAGGLGGPDIGAEVDRILVGAPTAWWTDTALMTRLGLSDVQKARIENTFQAHRQNLTTSKDALEKEEAQLSKLLEADPIDRPSVLTQINKVIQARSDMERTNATMTLEMREQLTRAQWTQLQAQPAGQVGLRVRGGGGRGAAPNSAAVATYAVDKSITLEGRVAALNLQEPRSSIVIEVVGTDGRTTRWTGEMAGLAQLTQQGWTRSSLSVGEKVAIEGAPSRDSSENAIFVHTVRRIPEQR